MYFQIKMEWTQRGNAIVWAENKEDALEKAKNMSNDCELPKFTKDSGLVGWRVVGGEVDGWSSFDAALDFCESLRSGVR